MALRLLALALIVHVCGSSSKDFYSIVYDESSLITSDRVAEGGIMWLINEWNASLGIPAKFPITRGVPSNYMLPPGGSARYICVGTGEWMLFV